MLNISTIQPGLNLKSPTDSQFCIQKHLIKFFCQCGGFVTIVTTNFKFSKSQQQKIMKFLACLSLSAPKPLEWQIINFLAASLNSFPPCLSPSRNLFNILVSFIVSISASSAFLCKGTCHQKLKYSKVCSL